jgi:hypothetical protein
MEEAVGVVLANAKIAGNTTADRIQINLATLRELATEHTFLFPDTAQIVQKLPDDLTLLVKGRIAEHAAKEAARLEAEREKIRAEETARLEREHAARERAAAAAAQREAAEAIERAAAEKRETLQAIPVSDVAAMQRSMLPERSEAFALSVTSTVAKLSVPASQSPADDSHIATIKLGEINKRIYPLSISERGLEELGFPSFGRDRASVLYRQADLVRICAALIKRLQGVA